MIAWDFRIVLEYTACHITYQLKKSSTNTGWPIRNPDSDASSADWSTNINVMEEILSWCILEQIWIKGPYLDQKLPQHESLYPIGLKSARIEIPHIVSHYIDFLKTDFY